MVITDSAKNEIAKNAKFLKIVATRGGCVGFQYDLEYKNEIVDEVQLNDWIITDIKSQILIENIMLDFVEEIERREFKITNQQAKKNCGCGSSFGF